MKIVLSVLLVISSLNIFGQSQLKFEQLNNLNLTIYLPNGYNSEGSYPVVYFNDGQMLFGKYGMNLGGALDSLISHRHIQPIIVVGIHADQYRTERYVPFEDPHVRNSMSMHEEYAAFLIDELVPWVDGQYSTLRNAKGRAIFGASFGGLNATWVALKYPESFSFSAGLSPSYWVNDHQIRTAAAKRSEDQVFWFDIGTAEWNYYVPMIDALETAGGNYAQDIFYLEDPNGEHNVSWWGKRVVNPLLLFAGRQAHLPKKMRLEIEVIPSRSKQDVFYQRINPIITCSSGLQYSLAQKASYTVLDPSTGIVKEDGRFSFSGTENMQIVVKYKDFEKKVVLKYQQIERMKDQM